jgi:hypothetical protein
MNGMMMMIGELGRMRKEVIPAYCTVTTFIWSKIRTERGLWWEQFSSGSRESLMPLLVLKRPFPQHTGLVLACVEEGSEGLSLVSPPGKTTVVVLPAKCSFKV